MRNELGITKAVGKQLDFVMAKYSRKISEVLLSRHGGKLSTAAHRSLSADFAGLQAEALAPLTPRQRLRLEQLSLQYFGASGLENPIVAERLGLSPGQVSKLNEADKLQLTMLLSGLSKNKDSRTVQLYFRSNARRANMEASAKRILTQAQWNGWLRMQGRPYRF